MVYLIFATGLLLGIIIGVLIEKYVFAYLDTLFDMFSIRKAEEATEYNLNMQILQCEAIRNYPELKEDNSGQGQTNVIGFQYNPEDDEEYYYEEEDIGK